jgi:hypothetical protein
VGSSRHAPKLHHYLPQAFLKRFADEHGQVWVLDRQRAEIRPQPVEVTAAERELYTIDADDGTKDRGLEHWFAEMVDGPSVTVLQGLHDGEDLKETDRRTLSLFAAGMFLRTPAFRETTRQMSDQMADWLRQMGVQPAGGESVPESLSEPGAVRTEDLLGFLEHAKGKDGRYQNEFVELVGSFLAPLSELLLRMNWVIGYAPQAKSFVASDRPVVQSRPHGHNPLYGVGITTPGSEKVVPLSARMALLIRDTRPKPTVECGVIDADRLRAVNEALVRQCERFVFARSRLLLESLLRQTGIGGTTPPVRAAVSGGGRKRPASLRVREDPQA